MSRENVKFDDDHIRNRKREFEKQIKALNDYVTSYRDSTTERVKLRKRLKRLKEEFGYIQKELDFQITQQYDDAMSAGEVLQESLETSTSRIPQPSTEVVTRDSPAPSTSSSFPLPAFKEIPTFDGRKEEWDSFKNAFQLVVHLNSKFSDIQKFEYLKNYLHGEAAKDIEAFTVSGRNYKDAWQHLLDKYDNNRDVILRHAELLLKTLPMMGDSPASMRNLVIDMQEHVYYLKYKLQRSWGNIANELLTSIAVSRMEEGVRKRWEQKFNEIPHIFDTFDFLYPREHPYMPNTHCGNNSHSGSSDTNFNNSQHPTEFCRPRQTFDAKRSMPTPSSPKRPRR